MDTDRYGRVEHIPARAVTPPIRRQTDDAYARVGDRRAEAVADGTLDPASRETSTSSEAEERRAEGERRPDAR